MMNKKAFSLAEALVTLLIVSITVAALVPTMTTKKAVSSGSFWILGLNNSVVAARASNYGIGVSNPAAKLHVNAAGTALKVKGISELETTNVTSLNSAGNIEGSDIRAQGDVTAQGNVIAHGNVTAQELIIGSNDLPGVINIQGNNLSISNGGGFVGKGAIPSGTAILPNAEGNCPPDYTSGFVSVGMNSLPICRANF